MAKTKVFVTFPNGGWIRKEVAETALSLILDGRYQLRLAFPTSPLVEECRNQMARQFVEEGHDFWLTIDHDTVPFKNPLDLVELDLDVVGCPYPLRSPNAKGESPIEFCAYKLNPENGQYHTFKGRGLQEVDAVGMGCTLIARRTVLGDSMKAPFLIFRDKDGFMECGEDFSFCKRAKSNGWKVWSNYDYPCFHHKEIELFTLGNALLEFYRGQAESKEGGCTAAPSIVKPSIVVV